MFLVSGAGALGAAQLPEALPEQALLSFAVKQCRPLADLIESGRFQQLVNPDLESEEEIQTLAADCQEVIASLSAMETARGRLPDALESVRGLCRLYLFFAQEGERVGFATSDDKALVRLREEVGLAPPRGFAFVSYFSSGKQVPEVEAAFTREETRGVTVFCRYIAIRREPVAPGKGRSEAARLRGILSHELVHGYVNSLLGWEHQRDLPKWFHEGCALYFAGNKPEELLSVSRRRAPGAMYTVVETSVLPEDYRNYRLVFVYLSRLKGEQAFYRFVRETIAEHSLDKSLSALAGTDSWEALLKAAKHWQDLQGYRFGLLALLLLLAIYTVHAVHSEWYEHQRLISAKTAVLLLLVAGLAYFAVKVLPGL